MAEAWAAAKNDGNCTATTRRLIEIAGQSATHGLNQAQVIAVCAGWKGKSRTTRYTRHQMLRQLLRAIGRSELEVPKVSRPDARTTIATTEEIARLIDCAEPWMKLVILLATATGLRRGDCLAITPANYDAERKLLTIRQEKTQRTLLLPAPPELQRVIEAIPIANQASTLVEHLRGGRPISKPGFDAAWQRLKKRAGVRRELWLHDLRRTLAVSLYELSKDLRVVEQALGHRSLATTTHYLEHRDPEKLRSLLAELWKANPKGETIQ